jgi:hypothetical protein
VATLNEQDLGKFASLAGDIESQLEPIVEITIRKKVASALTRVCRQARKATKTLIVKNHDTQE